MIKKLPSDVFFHIFSNAGFEESRALMLTSKWFLENITVFITRFGELRSFFEKCDMKNGIKQKIYEVLKLNSEKSLDSIFLDNKSKNFAILQIIKIFNEKILEKSDFLPIIKKITKEKGSSSAYQLINYFYEVINTEEYKDVKNLIPYQLESLSDIKFSYDFSFTTYGRDFVGYLQISKNYSYRKPNTTKMNIDFVVDRFYLKIKFLNHTINVLRTEKKRSSVKILKKNPVKEKTEKVNKIVKSIILLLSCFFTILGPISGSLVASIIYLAPYLGVAILATLPLVLKISIIITATLIPLIISAIFWLIFANIVHKMKSGEA